MRFGPFHLKPAERRLLRDDQPLTVGARAMDVLLALIERHPAPVSKDELLKAVWPDTVVEENNLQVHISALRKLIGPEAIATLPGRGYQFVAPLASDPRVANTRPDPPDRAGSPPDIGNLPGRAPVLFGRERDLAILKRMVQEQPLTTIVGSGGIGKTSAARYVARSVRSRFEHGVWMVELASLSDPALVIPTVARTLGVALPPQRDAVDTLIDSLKGQSLLLVLDNCEHLRAVVSELAGLLLQMAPDVTVLATSQAPLKLTEERLYRLPPLAVPDLRSAVPLDEAERYGAVRLLVERIRSQDTGFMLTTANLPDAISICRQLDGIPLAIELAGARVPLLGLAGVGQRLSHRLRLLAGGSRSSLRRHQTLRAALEWSHQLLHPAEQTVFRRIGVFAGGFSVASAQGVASDDRIDEWAVLDHLSSLIDRSLVVPDNDIPGRHRLLESARAFALECLAQSGETDAIRRRHAEVTRRQLDAWVRQRDMESLRREMNNVRTAFAWAAGDGGEGGDGDNGSEGGPAGDAQIAVALATGSAVILAVEGQVVESLERLLRVEPMVDRNTPPAVAARYWQWLGRLGVDGRLPISRCVDALRRAEAMFEAQGDLRHRHACLRMQAEALLSIDELEQATAALARAERLETHNTNVSDRLRRLRVASLLRDRQGFPDDAMKLAEQALQIATEGQIHRYRLILLADRATLRLRLGHAAEAAEKFQELAELSRSRPSDGLTLSQSLAGLISARLMLGQREAARATAVDALPQLERAGLLIARCEVFARLMAAENQSVVAARLLGAADQFHRRRETVPDPIARRNRFAAMELLRASGIAADLDHWISDGAAMTEGAVIAMIRAALDEDVRPSNRA